jgi:hypothetical protein
MRSLRWSSCAWRSRSQLWRFTELATALAGAAEVSERIRRHIIQRTPVDRQRVSPTDDMSAVHASGIGVQMEHRSAV